MSSVKYNPLRQLSELTGHFPKQHLLLAGALSAVIGSLVIKPEVFSQNVPPMPAPGLAVAASGFPADPLLLPGETLEPEIPYAGFTPGMNIGPMAVPPQAISEPEPEAAQSSSATADAAPAAEPVAEAQPPAPNEAAPSAPSIAPFALEHYEPLATIGAPLEVGLRLPPLSGNVPRDQEWVSQIIRPGDNLARLFQRAGAAPDELANLLESCAECKDLKHLAPGRSMDFAFANDGQLQRIRYKHSDLESTEVKRSGEKFAAKKVVRKPELTVQYQTAVIESSLFLAGKKAGLPHQMLSEFANIFGGEIDFVMDPRKGDTFTVVYEAKTLDGKTIGFGKILSAQFVNQGEVYTAYRYENGRGDFGYYNEKGESMRRAFMRAPLDFTRVTSPFNMNRFHPILKTIRPHRGVDYGAPIGTPVYASGDGRIVNSQQDGSQGNFVAIQHSSTYTTRYLHLSRRLVQSGQRVKQGQVIGYVGCTGLCSGPHLHYEFLVDGVHRDPKAIINKLAINTKLPPKDMVRFASMIKQQRQQLASLQQARSLASAKVNGGNKGG